MATKAARHELTQAENTAGELAEALRGILVATDQLYTALITAYRERKVVHTEDLTMGEIKTRMEQARAALAKWGKE